MDYEIIQDKVEGTEKRESSPLSIVVIIVILMIILGIVLAIILYSYIGKPSVIGKNQTISDVSLNLSINSFYINPGNRSLNITIYRIGEGNLSELYFIFYNIVGNQFFHKNITKEQFPKDKESKVYKINVSMVSGLNDFSKIKSAEIYYVVENISGNKIKNSAKVSPIFISGISPPNPPTPPRPPTPPTPCTPNCNGKECGDNGCGGSCGSCATGQSCNSSGQCVNCVSQNCSQLGKQCNSWNNGCGTTINCGNCSSGYSCDINGQCIIEPIYDNYKLMSKYSTKEAFLISDKNWKDVLSLVPVIVWTGNETCQKGYGTPNDVCVYPTLIWHEESQGFDADSIIYFMQQYSPSNVTIIGQSPNELDNLLVTLPGLGAGLNSNQVKKINSADYFSYWSNYSHIVYVEDNYELALLASTYASLINSPLVIKNTSSDVANVFIDKKVICVGNVIPAGNSCNESYNLSQLQQKYVQMTNTNKIILVNPNDLNISVFEAMQPEKSSLNINYLYTKDSLSSPILASAKHELLISNVNKNYQDVSDFLITKINNFNNSFSYLTIIASPQSIQSANNFNGKTFYFSMDLMYYSDTNKDMIPDLSIGRIYGLSSSDVSSYISRDIFYKYIPYSQNYSILYHDYNGFESKVNGKSSEKFLYNAGFSNKSIFTDTDGNQNTSRDMPNKKYISYYDHGFQNGWMSITSDSMNNEKIWLSPSFIISNACLTCSFDRVLPDNYHLLFCSNILRRGSLGYIGAIDETFGNVINSKLFLQHIFNNLSIGDSFKNEIIKYNGIFTNYILIGDPTFNFNEFYSEPEPNANFNTSNNILELDFPSTDKQNNFSFMGTKKYPFEEIPSKNIGYNLNQEILLNYSNGSFCGYGYSNEIKFYYNISLPENISISPQSIVFYKNGIRTIESNFSLSVGDLSYCYDDVLFTNLTNYKFCSFYEAFKNQNSQCLGTSSSLSCFLSYIKDFNNIINIYLDCHNFDIYNNSINIYPSYNYLINFSLINSTKNNICKDMTLPGQCSYNGRYCDNNGNLIYNCNVCNCVWGNNCQADGRCL